MTYNVFSGTLNPTQSIIEASRGRTVLCSVKNFCGWQWKSNPGQSVIFITDHCWSFVKGKVHNTQNYYFWATVTSNGSPYATGPLSCLPCLSVTLVYCSKTVGWIKMPLGMEVGLGPGDIVLDGTQLPPRKGAQQPPPTFQPMSVVAKRSPISNCWALVCEW